jgi:glycosyltransferase involved in cell wall biosynthesis
VNRELEFWAKERLFTKKIFYISNFQIFESIPNQLTILKGLENKRIVCLANLKKPKNHQFLIKIAAELKESNPDWTFHLVGKAYDDDYSKAIYDQIAIDKLENNVFIYNSKLDIENILNQSTIAILTSESEGLPVAFLEYGLSSKAVIATSVGEIPMIIENNVNGILIESGNVNQFHKAIVHLIENTELISIFGLNLNTTILQRFDSKIIIKSYLDRLIKI